MPAILDFTKPHVLRNDEEYSAAVERVDELLRLDIDDGSEEAEELLFLSVLIEEYEDRENPIEGATPQEVVDFALEQRGMEAGALQEPGSRASRNAADPSGAPARLIRGESAILTGSRRLIDNPPRKPELLWRIVFRLSPAYNPRPSSLAPRGVTETIRPEPQ